MASASPSTRASFKCGPKAFRNSHLHGYLKSVVSFPVSQASDSLYSPIRVVNRAYGSNLIVTASKSTGLNTALSSTNGSLKVPGKILFAAVPVTRTKFLSAYLLHSQEKVKFIKLFNHHDHSGFLFLGVEARRTWCVL